MDIISWLESGDIVLKSLVRNALLDESFSHNNQGIIDHYLRFYNDKDKMWDGIYSPLWTSNHYTLLELKYIRIDPEHSIYQEATSEKSKIINDCLNELEPFIESVVPKHDGDKQVIEEVLDNLENVILDLYE